MAGLLGGYRREGDGHFVVDLAVQERFDSSLFQRLWLYC